MQKKINIEELGKKAPQIKRIINSFYPLKLEKTDENYWTQSGILEILSLVDTNIVNETNLNKNWKYKICHQIESRLNLKVKGATLGMVPNYGGIIELERNANLGETIEIHFYISFLMNVYSIQIVFLKDNMNIKRPQSYLKNFVTTGIQKLVVSPIKNMYLDEYQAIESIIIENFENPIFLPYSIEKLKLQNLTVTYKDDENCLIGDAFFHKVMPINYFYGSIPTILGDENYKLNLLL
ncbi:hypothetical protein [Maribacter sp. IgM3_T14_3]|uniref:hypothetical protein n=1 Tax=Maribacter sp. IgM3_T14_3 TaxID=3415140 RepID=UPI003C6FF99B